MHDVQSVQNYCFSLHICDVLASVVIVVAQGPYY